MNNIRIIINKNNKLIINSPLLGGIEIWVDDGSNSEPYYQFYLDSDGQTIMEKLDVSVDKIYTFYRLNSSSSHLFYISDNGYKQESSNKITLSDENSIIVPNTMYEFNNTYTNTFTPVTTLEANEGYWIKASSAGTIKLIKQEQLI